MSAVTLPRQPSPEWARAAFVLLVTLLAHLWVLERAQRVLGDAPATKDAPEVTVTARLLPPPAATILPSPPAPVPTEPPKRRPAPIPKPPPAAGAATPSAVASASFTTPVAAAPPAAESFDEPARTTSNEALAETPLEEEAQTDNPSVPTAVALNAERPLEYREAVDAVDFDASGPALRAALARLPSVQTTLPASARYVYRTTFSELRLAGGTTTIDWSLVEDRYRLRMTTEALGTTLIELDSKGKVQAFGLAPERYVEKRVRRGAAAANFDWEARRVTFSARSHEQPLGDGIQDRISFQFQLMLLGRTLPERFKPGRQTTLRIASRDDVSVYRLRSAGRDTTNTSLGQLDTVKIERVPERDSDAKIEVWLAPELGWLPARLRFTHRHGRITESLLESSATP